MAAGTLVVAAVAGGVALLYVFRDVVFLLLVAIFGATALEPLVARLQRLGRSRAAGVITVYGGLGLVLAAAAIVVLPVVVEQLAQALGALPNAYKALRAELLANPNVLLARPASAGGPT